MTTPTVTGTLTRMGPQFQLSSALTWSITTTTAIACRCIRLRRIYLKNTSNAKCKFIVSLLFEFIQKQHMVYFSSSPAFSLACDFFVIGHITTILRLHEDLNFKGVFSCIIFSVFHALPPAGGAAAALGGLALSVCVCP